jgi:hypothetical protein
VPAFDRGVLDRLAGNFRLIRIDDVPPSPAKAINLGLASARAQVIGVMIDSARIVTPGLLHFAVHGMRMFKRAVVMTLGWYLGSDSSQRFVMDTGYDKPREGALFASIDWMNDGYRLFEIVALDESSVQGWLSPANELNALLMHRGFDEGLACTVEYVRCGEGVF